MEEITLEAKNREIFGRKNRILKEAGEVPAVVYGSGIKPKNISIDRNSFIKTYRSAGESTLVNLVVEQDKPVAVLIQDYQKDPVKDDVTHVDFFAVDMNKELEAVVDLVFVGESVAVKSLGGTLVQSRDRVTIKCLPSKLVRGFEVDLSKLNTFDDVFHVSDLNVPEGVQIMDNLDLTIAVVAEPRTQAEVEALDDSVEEDIADVEVEGEKKEGEEGEKKEGESSDDK